MPLTEEQKKEMKEILENLLKESTIHIQSLKEQSKPVSLDDPIGRVTRIDAIQMQNMAMATLQREEENIQMTDTALKKLEQGTFGECSACKKQIQWERLKALPGVSLCINCAR